MHRWATVVGLMLVVAGSAMVTIDVLSERTAGSAPSVDRPGAVVVEHDPDEFPYERDADVPALPFDDNPDPLQCGIPTPWGIETTAYLTGMWEGELIQPEVLLYDSHLRLSVTGGASHGTPVQIILFQENPVLDYYFVKILGDEPQEGWVPEHFLSFEPVT